MYINPTYVVSLRPDPVDPDHLSVVKLRDGESIRVRGDREAIADKLARAASAGGAIRDERIGFFLGVFECFVNI